MTTRRSHIAHALLSGLTLLMLTVACERKDLYLRVDQTQIDIAVYDIRLELLWGMSWHTEWQYEWDEELYGPIGYTMPHYVRASIYDVDSLHDYSRTNCYTRNFPASGGRVSLNAGAWYDMLFYNTGTEYILFDQSSDYAYYHASTRTSDYVPVISRGEHDTPQGTEPFDYVSYKQPDELFGTFLEQLLVSEDPTDYDKITDEETGEIVYVYNINAQMNPYSFIYMLQVMVVNNVDSVGPIISVKRALAPGDTVRCASSGMTLTGVAKGVDLFTRQTFSEAASITVDEGDIRYMKPKDDLTLPDGTHTHGDLFAARVLTWGLPGIEPLWEWEQMRDSVDSRSSSSRMPTLTHRNKLGVRFWLRNGYSHVEVFDVTDQLRSHPAGGIITVVMDAREKISDEELEQKDPDKGGGFDASVGDWGNEMDADITI